MALTRISILLPCSGTIDNPGNLEPSESNTLGSRAGCAASGSVSALAQCGFKHSGARI